MTFHLLCDFDGTLIDSAPTILAAYRRVLAANGIEPTVPLVPGLIGPPLVPTLRQLTGIGDPAELERLAGEFRHAYDHELLPETLAYPDIEAALAQVRSRGIEVYVVTNKRISPTRAIVRHLGWEAHFRGVYAMDAFQPALPSKAAVLKQVMADHAIDPALAAYLGDRAEDAEAALAAGLRFVRAGWGYGLPGSFTVFPAHDVLGAPAALAAAFSAAARSGSAAA